MTEGSPHPPPAGQRLDSWKEVAAYLKRDTATVRRWEKREGLPVHRHQHDKLGSVYAYTSELDTWLVGRRRQIDEPAPAFLTKRARWIAAVTLLLVAAAGGVYQFRDAGVAEVEARRIRVAVHRPGTIAGLIAGGLLEVLKQRLPDLDVEAVEEPGMIATLRAIDGGEVDLGLAFNLVAFHAVKTDRVLGHRSDAIAALTVAYSNAAQIVVRRDSKVKTIADLKGKRVGLGMAEGGGHFCSQILLSHLGFEPGDLFIESQDFGPERVTELLDGRLDAYIDWRGLPVPDLAEAFATGRLRLIPLEAESLQGLRLKHPFLIPWAIPARVYPHQESSISTVAARMLVIGSRSLPPELVDQILQTITAHMPDLIARHPAAAEINVKKRPTLEDGLSIDLHPGAERFFQRTAAD